MNNEEIILVLDKKFNSDELIIEHSVYHNLLSLSPHNYYLWFLHNKRELQIKSNSIAICNQSQAKMGNEIKTIRRTADFK